MFWRIQQLLKVTINSLRQQIINKEAGRLANEVKDTLEDFSQDHTIKEKLLTSRRVTLAEELSEQFIRCIFYFIRIRTDSFYLYNIYHV
jgi:hypothetical protein